MQKKLNILVIDTNILLMSSVFAWRKRGKRIPLPYFILLQLYKYVKLTAPNKVYITADLGTPWRKILFSGYKEGRKEFKASFKDLNWPEIYQQYNQLLDDIQFTTPMQVVQIDNIEADDIISYLCRYEKGDITIVSKDKDLQQLLILPNVSMIVAKKKGQTTEYVKLDEPEIENIVDVKIKKGDRSDKIPKATSFSEEVRNAVLVDLFNLPKIVDLTIRNDIEQNKNDPADPFKFLEYYPYDSLKQSYQFLVKSCTSDDQNKC